MAFSIDDPEAERYTTNRYWNTSSATNTPNDLNTFETRTYMALWTFQLLASTKTMPGRVAQSVTCLATDACLTADPGVASSIPARSHTFVVVDHEIISTVILLLPLIHSRRVVVSCAQITGQPLVQACPRKVWLGELTVPQ